MSIAIKRPVFMCGENPGMTLYAPGTDQPSAIASYWHVTYSAYGSGNALVLWLQTGHGGVFTDNLLLARALIDTLTQYFPEFSDTPVGALPHLEAACQHRFNGTDRYVVTCQTRTNKYVLEWASLLDHKLVLWPQFPAGQQVFDLSTVICPCRHGAISIDGKTIPGEVQTGTSSDGHQSSTAFLAFAESWLGPFQPNA